MIKIRKNIFDDTLSVSYSPVGWMRFYVKIRFPFLIAVSSLSYFYYIIKTDFSTYKLTSLLFVLFYLGLDLLNLALLIWAYIEMKKLSYKGYILNIIHLCYSVFYYSLGKGVVSLAKGQFEQYFLIFLIGRLLLWVLPNFIYFYKRRDLFSY